MCVQTRRLFGDGALVIELVSTSIHDGVNAFGAMKPERMYPLIPPTSVSSPL
jgi:hypothetical protein